MNPIKPIELNNQIVYPKPETVKDPDLGPQSFYRHQLSLPINLKSPLASIKEPQKWYLQVEYQGCAESSGFCYPPQTSWMKLEVNHHQIESLSEMTSPPDLASSEPAGTTEPAYPTHETPPNAEPSPMEGTLKK